MNELYRWTIAELQERETTIFWMPLWERDDYLRGEQALSALASELALRRIWAE